MLWVAKYLNLNQKGCLELKKQKEKGVGNKDEVIDYKKYGKIISKRIA